MNFIEYAISKGINLIKDDIKFIELRVMGYQRHQKHIILKRYIDEWLLGMAECPKSQKTMNLGRFRANTYLRTIKK